MRLTKMNTIYQLSFMTHFFPVNCYLVEEVDSFTLIDAALPFCKKSILNTARKLGKPLSKIVLTHAHSDHLGALDGLKEELPNVEVLLPKRELKLLEGDLSLEEGEGNMPIKGSFPKKMKTRPDTLINDGNQIGSLVAIHSPGHTPGMMAFMDVRNNSLIAGDAFQTKGGIAVSGNLRVSFPFPALATWNKEVAIQSAENLLSFKPSLLAVGHGNIMTKPEKNMKQAINQAKKYLLGGE
ncbi:MULTISPECIES: MBL fold metallo-hydrolase [Bacillus]|uniref:MBL fold metallo-hydrolase n=1 Tax=Bacillus TaxID=1386 RepID=UPI00030E8F0A|nr:MULTISPECIES: MBL fold metallo-hydrolase [Bacillus]